MAAVISTTWPILLRLNGRPGFACSSRNARLAGLLRPSKSTTPLGMNEHSLGFDELDDRRQPLPGLQVAEDEGPRAAHPARVAVHDLERGADHRREVDLVDHQQVRLDDAGAAFARDLVARGDVD